MRPVCSSANAWPSSVPATTLWDVLTVVTELVTNAVRHGRGGNVRIGLSLAADGKVSGEVENDGPGRVELRPIETTSTSGMGLHIVGAIVDRWRVFAGRSTRVRFEVPGPGSARDRRVRRCRPRAVHPPPLRYAADSARSRRPRRSARSSTPRRPRRSRPIASHRRRRRSRRSQSGVRPGRAPRGRCPRLRAPRRRALSVRR
jgi:anti-sigma regulatory factor (Ser/Thr protein kinase)